MIKIDDVSIPAPDNYNVGIMDISNAERNAAGTMIIERIATKRKLTLNWQQISNKDLSSILTLVSPVFFYVTYPDPQDGKIKGGTFYSGDRTADGLMYKDGIMYWKSLKFDLIER